MKSIIFKMVLAGSILLSPFIYWLPIQELTWVGDITTWTLGLCLIFITVYGVFLPVVWKVITSNPDVMAKIPDVDQVLPTIYEIAYKAKESRTLWKWVYVVVVRSAIIATMIHYYYTGQYGLLSLLAVALLLALSIHSLMRYTVRKLGMEDKVIIAGNNKKETNT